MAFSNYILHMLICTTKRYGAVSDYSEGSPGRDRLKIVVVIWTLQLLMSRAWPAKLRYRPLEWLRRSLTYSERNLFSAPLKACPA
jgi:uncharacterized protein